MKTTPRIILAVAASLIALPAIAEDSGFLSDYSLLQTRGGDAAVVGAGLEGVVVAGATHGYGLGHGRRSRRG